MHHGAAHRGVGLAELLFHLVEMQRVATKELERARAVGLESARAPARLLVREPADVGARDRALVRPGAVERAAALFNGGGGAHHERPRREVPRSPQLADAPARRQRHG